MDQTYIFICLMVLAAASVAGFAVGAIFVVFKRSRLGFWLMVVSGLAGVLIGSYFVV
jgi:hypothetical protein